MLEIMKILLPNDLDNYINSLTSTYPQIREIWLFGSRSNPPYKKKSDWDFLVFADSEVLERLRHRLDIKKNDIDLLIVYDGNHFKSPWPCSDKTTKAGTLFPSSISCRNFNWNLRSKTEATYSGTKSTGNGGWDIVDRKAYRIYPKSK